MLGPPFVLGAADGCGGWGASLGLFPPSVPEELYIVASSPDSEVFSIVSPSSGVVVGPLGSSGFLGSGSGSGAFVPPLAPVPSMRLNTSSTDFGRLLGDRAIIQLIRLQVEALMLLVQS